jgi:hypothetical protein
MSEFQIKRGAGGKFLPGVSANPGGTPSFKMLRSNELIGVLNQRYSDEEIIEKLDAVWDEAVSMRGVKTMMAWLEFVITWRAGGKLPTKHIRVNTKFEDMLAQLGSNEQPVTIEGETTEE